jgi:hypothetical protein
MSGQERITHQVPIETRFGNKRRKFVTQGQGRRRASAEIR